MKRIVLPLTLLLAAAPLAGVAQADHPQRTFDERLGFDHRGGNEWWVEVRLVGWSAGDVVEVQAKDDDSGWTTLTPRDWGNWAGVLRVEPDHRVRYRAVLSDGDVLRSCQFTHPAGAEWCGPYAERQNWWFDHLGGDAGRVVVEVEREHEENRGPSPVLARVEGSEAWTRLERQEGDVWAGPLDAPPGARVQFEARLAGGMSWAAIERSCWFTHPEGLERCEGPGEGMAAEFHGVSGNAWWVQVDVEATRPLAKVEARVDGGWWTELQKRGWGAWAASLHVPDGARVEFRATSVDGHHAFSHGAWLWPDQRPHPPAGEAFDARFHNVKGNAWWVQTDVDANAPVSVVMARITQADRSWDRLEPLPLQPWGEWADGIHVEPGQRVQFEAVGLDGTRVTSGWYDWPPT